MTGPQIGQPVAISQPNQSFPVGKTDLVTPVADGPTGYLVSFDGVQFTDPLHVVTLTLDLSLDGGATWASQHPSQATDPFPITAVIPGGMLDRNGLPKMIHAVGTKAMPGNASRQIKASVSVAHPQGKPLVTTVSTITAAADVIAQVVKGGA